MRIGKRVKNNRITDNRGISLVELIVVISIMVIMTGLISLGVSIMFSRDANYVAVRIDDALTETRMYSMSKSGNYTCVLHIDSDTMKNSVEIKKGDDIYKNIPLDKSVTITVEGTVSTPTPSATGNIVFAFNKANGSVETVNGSKGEGVYTIKVTSEKNKAKTRSVTVVATTGRHYTEK